MSKLTTIQISEETKERLKPYGKIGDTYEIALSRVLDRIEELEAKIGDDKNPLEAVATA
jgi:hypothetical protein